ncbi:DNA replication regulator SLD2 [Colletotrichum sidae]|uniref:DNA replication regulator SLD2 n=1 Tax=Colletotrichum sidae TaxID=1347389 RepID=A0A4R8TBG0_9PEZI|nr:DNA replication regulator SLD2 [Colletotrichum sidae]
MDDQTRAEYESQSQTLRLELKSWESSWAKSHDGKKPGRDDIKSNPDIAQKYKLYNKVRDILSGKLPPPAKEDLRPKKRKENPAQTTTPSKRHKQAETPSKSRSNHDVLAQNTTPSISRTLFSPVAPRSIGPTPQRDGRVLGLFDLMIEKEHGTPSRRNGHQINLNTLPSSNILTTTPKKRSSPMDETPKLSRTPMSTSKRQMLNSFMTPLKNKDGTMMDAKTPTAVSKLQFNTPSFLKRHTVPPAVETKDFDAPPLRLPRKPMIRGLSSIVASLRKVEEEALDDDLEALREAEGEGAGAPVTRAMGPSKPVEPANDLLAPDPMAKNLPLGGFDDEAVYDSSDGEQLDRNGKPLRVFKKKGQKRTTRRSNIKPVHHKRPSGPVEGEARDEDEEEIVPETQVQGLADDLPGELADMGSDSDFEGPDSKAKEPKETKRPEKVGTVKKAVKKVNELAHTNFRRLKLRNTGSKGGPGYNSKFRRRR